MQVVRRRQDGFHDLASLFQAIDYGDILTFTLAKKDSLIGVGPFGAKIPLDNTNLILKSAALFRRKTGLNFGIEIFVEKHVPLQAGLGGGSGNAATTLWALNELCDRPASLSDLILWSGELGSDITFFLSEGTAYCTSRGEVMKSLPELPKYAHSKKIFIVKPPEGLSTKDVFSKLNLALLPPRNPEINLENFYKELPDFYNDLEPAAFDIEPSLLLLKLALQAGGFEKVVMTGAGSTFFCIGDGIIPPWPDLLWRQVHFIRREEEEWYKPKVQATTHLT